MKRYWYYLAVASFAGVIIIGAGNSGGDVEPAQDPQAGCWQGGESGSPLMTPEEIAALPQSGADAIRMLRRNTDTLAAEAQANRKNPWRDKEVASQAAAKAAFARLELAETDGTTERWTATSESGALIAEVVVQEQPYGRWLVTSMQYKVPEALCE